MTETLPRVGWPTCRNIHQVRRSRCLCELCWAHVRYGGVSASHRRLAATTSRSTHQVRRSRCLREQCWACVRYRGVSASHYHCAATPLRPSAAPIVPRRLASTSARSDGVAACVSNAGHKCGVAESPASHRLRAAAASRSTHQVRWSRCLCEHC